MDPAPASPPVSRSAFWIGCILSALPALLLIFSAVMKFMRPPAVMEGFAHLGIPGSMATGLGILEVVCTVIYLVPCTAVLGAVLLTGYLGGAVLATLRVGDAYYAPVILGVLVWGGLYLRDPRLRALLPTRCQGGGGVPT